MGAPDVVIVGGGLVGLSAAWRLAQRGVSVTVIDDARVGQSSAAAAGMLAPLAEGNGPGPGVDLGLASLERYPAFVAALAEETGQSVPLSGPGLLRLAFTEEDEERLCRALHWQRQMGLPLEWLGADAVHALEPSLPATVRGAVRSVREQHLSPRPLHAALTVACRGRGVRLQHGSVLGLGRTGGRAHAVRTAHGIIGCDAVVIAAGAWTPVLAETLGLQCPVVPTKGQILALGPQMPTAIRHTVYTCSGYLVPRAEGQIIVGATEERVGFDTATTAAGINSLLAMAMAMVPCLGTWPLHSVWTGLRPVSPDGAPLLGLVPGWDNVTVATGHGRNGVLLAPVTADLLADHLLSGSDFPSAFRPERFETVP